ncbi:MAG: hypothetical protein LBM01_00655 [Christensenellaceae bacterium]|jgi:prolyl-tRNA synthetase|nr:hypothetical protein [Christensenellaceae bacterium]
MKFTQTLIPTLKEVPADCDKDNIAQILMTRSGMIKKMFSGFYTALPLYNILRDKIENEIRLAMREVGCFEVKFPVIATKESFEESGRWEKFGGEMFRTADRTEHILCLSPTNEEASCAVAKAFLTSYTQLPFCMFQIQKKYRDEIRPRGGLMRAREFSMKDAYSFHLTDKDLDGFYNEMRGAYVKLFKKLGFKAIPVSADNGSMGGSASEEFMVESPSGSDEIFVCDSCGFGANSEVFAGEVCPKCGAGLRKVKAFEVGHIFKLGDYYTKKLGITCAAQSGEQKTLTMGCYGIGVDRVISAIIETFNDENGIAYPAPLAPITFNLITANMKDEAQVKASELLYNELKHFPVEVLWDNRDVSIGAKFKDSDLIGVPYRIIVGKSLAQGEVEFSSRDGKVKTNLKIENALKEILMKLLGGQL